RVKVGNRQASSFRTPAATAAGVLSFPRRKSLAARTAHYTKSPQISFQRPNCRTKCLRASIGAAMIRHQIAIRIVEAYTQLVVKPSQPAEFERSV
ncbi:MAG: hypothetical protein V4764_16595, partial [Burkholderia sp.]